MSFTLETLITAAREYYPAGFPPEEDDYTEPLLPFQRTLEYARWCASWEKALQWKEWDSLREPFQAAFPGQKMGEATQPWVSACRRRVVYFEESSPGGRTQVLRLVGAVSILFPVYLVYMTVEDIEPGDSSNATHLHLKPTKEMRAQVLQVASIFERELSYKPFPIELADAPLESLRIGFLNLEKPTLLNAFFSNDLANLP